MTGPNLLLVEIVVYFIKDDQIGVIACTMKQGKYFSLETFLQALADNPNDFILVGVL